jgi:hypothetical protein
MGVCVQNFTQLVGHAVFFRPFIWSRLFGLMRSRECASNFVEISEILAVIRQAFGEESMSRTWELGRQGQTVNSAHYCEVL